MTTDAERSHPLRHLAEIEASGDGSCFAKLSEAQAAFESVRDIPYAVQYQLFGSDQRLRIGNGRGCSQKANQLNSLFTKLGLHTELRRVPFRWGAVLDRLSGIPDRLLEAAVPLEPRWHVFLSVKFPSRRINVDPTWDNGLRHTGLPFNAILDPNADMALAVPLNEVVSVADHANHCLPNCGPAQTSSLVRHKHYYVFVLHFNRWLEKQRMANL